MPDQLSILSKIYTSPMEAFSRVLDQGSFLFAASVALAGNFLIALARSAAAPPLPPEMAGNPFFRNPEAFSLGNVIEWLIPLALLFVPACAAISAISEGLGSAGVILRRDFMPLLVCDLTAWGAAHIPVGIAAVVIANVIPEATGLVLVLRAAGFLLFLTFAGCAVRSTSGANVGHAAGIVIAATFAMVGGAALWAVFPGRGFLFSPFLLFWIWMLWRPDFSGFTGGLQSRQRFQQNLEAATLNPRDADAHYQLGLIYQERRNYTDAIERFEKAMEIDPEEPDPIYQLGRIAQEQERYSDARQFYERVAALDEKHSSSEVWRDLGAVKLKMGEVPAALQDLEKYVDRRPYDPEGQYWLGEAQRQSGNTAAAQTAFKAAIEAGETAPRHLKTRARKWVGLAQSGLRQVS